MSCYLQLTAAAAAAQELLDNVNIINICVVVRYPLTSVYLFAASVLVVGGEHKSKLHQPYLAH